MDANEPPVDNRLIPRLSVRRKEFKVVKRKPSKGIHCRNVEIADFLDKNPQEPPVFGGPPPINTLDTFEALVDGVFSNDINLRLKAIRQMVKFLMTGLSMLCFTDRGDPIQRVIDSQLVPCFVRYLKAEMFPELQFEAATALMLTACGTSEETKVLVDNRAVPILVKLLASQNEDIREQAIWALRNIAGDSPRLRDVVLKEGALLQLLVLFKIPATLSMSRHVAGAISTFYGGNPPPQLEQTRSAVLALGQLVLLTDEVVLEESCWALCHLLNGKDDRISVIFAAADVCMRLVKLLGQCQQSLPLGNSHF